FTWTRTPQTFDNDLNPEGFATKFNWDTTTPYLKNLSFQPFILFFNEASSGTDSFAVGGQVAGRVQIGPLTTSPSVSLIKWNTPDALFAPGNLFATQQSPGEGPGCRNPSGTPGGTTLNCTFAPNTVTNATFL